MKNKSQASTPEQYLAELAEPRRSEFQRIHELVRETLPDLEPHMQSGMLGYGRYHYKYASGREGDWFRVGLASNKRYISLYICAADERGYVAERFRERMPKADIGKSCVRFKRLDDLDRDALLALLLAAKDGSPQA